MFLVIAVVLLVYEHRILLFAGSLFPPALLLGCVVNRQAFLAVGDGLAQDRPRGTRSVVLVLFAATFAALICGVSSLGCTEASSVTTATSIAMPFAAAVLGLRLVPKTR